MLQVGQRGEPHCFLGMSHGHESHGPRKRLDLIRCFHAIFSYPHLFFQNIAEPIKLSEKQKGVHITPMHRYSKKANKEERDVRKSQMNNMFPKRGCWRKDGERSNESSTIQRNSRQKGLETWAPLTSVYVLRKRFCNDRKRWTASWRTELRKQVGKKNKTLQRWKPHSKQQKPENTSSTKPCKTSLHKDTQRIVEMIYMEGEGWWCF